MGKDVAHVTSSLIGWNIAQTLIEDGFCPNHLQQEDGSYIQTKVVVRFLCMQQPLAENWI